MEWQEKPSVVKWPSTFRELEFFWELERTWGVSGKRRLEGRASPPGRAPQQTLGFIMQRTDVLCLLRYLAAEERHPLTCVSGECPWVSRGDGWMGKLRATTQASQESRGEVSTCTRRWKAGNGGSPNKKADLMGFDRGARDALGAGPGERAVRYTGHKIEGLVHSKDRAGSGLE